MTDEIETNGEVMTEESKPIEAVAEARSKEPPSAPAHDAEACLQEIRDAEKEVAEAELAHLRAKDAAKVAKEFWEAKVEAMRRVIRASTEELPLFDRPKASPTPPDDEAWKATPIADLGLPKVIVSALEEADIISIGALSEWTYAGKELIDIKGIGESKADQIRDTLEKFWAEREAAKAKAAASEPAVIETDTDAESQEDVPVGAPVPPGEPISTEERQRVNPSKPKRSTKRSSPKRKAASRR